MRTVLDDILQSGVVTDARGAQHQVHSNTSPAQCLFLRELIGRIDARRCLEIGLAYGISSLAICEEINGKAGASLISIDPHQGEHWNDIGVLNLERAGFGAILEFHRRPSHEVLPRLLQEGQRVDFAYVDTSKIFDVVLLDAYYITRLLMPGGIIVFDDCSWPGIRKVVRYIATWPHLEVFAVHGPTERSWTQRLGYSLAKAIPLRSRILRPELIHPDMDLGVGAECVAFQKNAEDERPWNWSLIP